MTTRGFILAFSEDLRWCRVTDEAGNRLLAAAIRGEVPVERRDRIAKLVGDLMAECQGADVVIAPFVGGTPS